MVTIDIHFKEWLKSLNFIILFILNFMVKVKNKHPLPKNIECLFLYFYNI